MRYLIGVLFSIVTLCCLSSCTNDPLSSSTCECDTVRVVDTLKDTLTLCYSELRFEWSEIPSKNILISLVMGSKTYEHSFLSTDYGCTFVVDTGFAELEVRFQDELRSPKLRWSDTLTILCGSNLYDKDFALFFPSPESVYVEKKIIQTQIVTDTLIVGDTLVDTAMIFVSSLDTDTGEYFDGIGDYRVISNDSLIEMDDTFSISMDFKTASTVEGRRFLFGKRNYTEISLELVDGFMY